MILSKRLIAISGSLIVCCSALGAANSSEFTGRWEVTTTYPGGSFVAGLNVAVDKNGYRGRSGYLVPDDDLYTYAGAMQKDKLQLQIFDGKTAIGSLVLRVNGDILSGDGVLKDVPIKLVGRRPVRRPSDTSTVHNFVPTMYYRTFSAANPPALHIFPGDTVRTKTLDAAGGGEGAGRDSLPGNPQTGPFYIEGAMIGDTIAVHFNKIRPNRDTAFQRRARLDPRVLPAGYTQQQAPREWSDIWILDRKHGTATPANPSDSIKGLVIKLNPMLGCVSVAPYWNQGIETEHLGSFGGNMDYNQIREGTTLYLPVYQAGALLTIGDGHAFQADGEITGQGLETSMDVEFTVDLIPDQFIDQVWAESDDYIMVSGIGGSLNEALQIANAGISNWLKAFYRLNSAEIATVLAASIHYDIAEVVDPEVHVVAKLGKAVLMQIPKPKNPSTVFCRPLSGCAAD